MSRPLVLALLLAWPAVSPAANSCPPPGRRECAGVEDDLNACRTTGKVVERNGSVSAGAPAGKMGVALGGSTSSQQVACDPEWIQQLSVLAGTCGQAQAGSIPPDLYWRKWGDVYGIDGLDACRSQAAARQEQTCSRKQVFDGADCVDLWEASWRVTVESLNVTQERRPDGTLWDSMSTATAAPDVMITAALTQTECDDTLARTTLWTIPPVQDSFQPTFGVGGRVGRLSYGSRLCFIVVDSDAFSNQTMSVYTITGQILEDLLRGRYHTVTTPFGRLELSFLAEQ